MSAARLLSILMLLQAHGRMSAQALAATVEVSIRTVYRDIDQLSAAGVPVYAERGRAGGFQLLEGWRTQLTGLTAAEAQALFLAGLPGPAAELGVAGTLAAAERKLLAALPAGWQEDAQRMSSRFHLDPVGWFQSAPPADHVSIVAEAVWGERRLSMRYESWAGIVEREVEPLGLVLKAGAWYLAASACGEAGTGGEPRTYRLASIRELTISAECFSRPPGFDLGAYWTASTARFEAGVYRGEAVLRVSPRGLERLRGLGPALADAAASGTEAAGADGWARLAVPIESIDHAAQEMLKLGAEAEVLEPAELRQRMAETARRLVALYEEPPAE